MIHIVSVYKDEWYEKGQALEKEHPVYRLYSRENTEYEFNLPLVWHEDAYQDEVSKLLMKEIGGAVWSVYLQAWSCHFTVRSGKKYNAAISDRSSAFVGVAVRTFGGVAACCAKAQSG